MSRYEKLIKDPIQREEKILSLWKGQNTFAKSLEQTKGRPSYVFYEGPPTANGKPHFGHLMPRVYKDLFPRYKTMQGFYAERKGGWDTHGLPVELEVEKELGINSKQEIEAYGVEEFVNRCKESVWRYKRDWEKMIERMGFWIDLENAYITYTDDYIESEWWELAQMFERGLLYKGHKVVPYCPRCGTALSSHEVAQGYRKVEDPSIFVRLIISSDKQAKYNLDLPGKTSLLTWTTTPWTLPANVALAIAPAATYAEIEQDGARLILARARVDASLSGDYEIVREFPGSALVGLRYKPVYPLVNDERAYHVHPAGWVNLEEGTGIVHSAPAFGEDDYNLGLEVGLPLFQPVDLNGKFVEGFPLCSGLFVKKSDPIIIEDLQTRGLLYRTQPYEHDYPFCWRCGTPLLYYAMDSWYIKTTAVKDEIIANNQLINWYPPHIKNGRLGDFLDNLKDWALSRDRYWGTPLNLWVCQDCGEINAIESRATLVERAKDRQLAQTVELHRPYLDRVELVCPKCGGTMQRVSNVIDTWFDSGSMHTAQWHYPFENKDKFKDSFPADFICEAMEQTRGWFYTLLATSTIIHGKPAYRNCVATGLGLDETGIKMSKSKGNVIDPWKIVEMVGADSLRWYLCSSSAPWKSKRLGEANVKEPLYRFLDTLRNTYDFFALYASIDAFDPAIHQAEKASLSPSDRWLNSRFASTVDRVTTGLDQYDVIAATEALEQFLDDLSNWYIRSSRRRFWKGGMGNDKIAAYSTLYRSLIGLAKLLAPFIPFITEAIYQQLRRPEDPESVHLCTYPLADEQCIDLKLEEEMTLARRLTSLGHQARNNAQIKVRQPLRRCLVEGMAPLSSEVTSLLKTELNIEEVEFVQSLSSTLQPSASPNFSTLGPRLGPLTQAAADWIERQQGGKLQEQLSSGTIEVDIDGKQVQLTEADLSFAETVPEWGTLIEEGGIRLLLDTRLDAALREKGLMREVTHRIQLLRKAAGFAVSDRISLGYTATSSLQRIIEDNKEEIAAEILATKIEQNLGTDYEYREELMIAGGQITCTLTRQNTNPTH
ncbi:MAG: isoleucine--tRNA ligase [Candidatus Bipolaricaulota bacterium]|nr:isoleucine--tRNA ligase [Candidatus Bipolaricaulota bacterium]